MPPTTPAKAENRPSADRPNPTTPQVDEELEVKKARGQTDSQKAIKKYHEGEFQKNDPITGEAREKGDKVLDDSK